MDYLSNYYKNLSEQLQSKVNHLKRLVETADSTPNNFDGPDADKLGSPEEVAAATAKISAMPDFHNTVIAHMATAFGDRYGQNTGHGRKLTLKVAADLHKAAGEGGFRDLDHASSTLRSYMQDSPEVAYHHEERAIEDPTLYGVHHDDVMDIDFSDAIDDDHTDIDSDVFQSMLRKQTVMGESPKPPARDTPGFHPGPEKMPSPDPRYTH